MLCLYDPKNVLGIARCHDSLVQLDMLGRGPATWQRSVLMRRPIISWLITARMLTNLLTRRDLSIVPWFTAPIVISVRVNPRIGGPRRIHALEVEPPLAITSVPSSSSGFRLAAIVVKASLCIFPERKVMRTIMIGAIYRRAPVRISIRVIGESTVRIAEIV